MFISVERYGVSWMLRPLVIILFAMAHLRPAAAVLAGREDPRRLQAHADRFRRSRTSARPTCSTVFLIVLVAVMLVQASAWNCQRQDRADDRRRAWRSSSPTISLLNAHLPQPGRAPAGRARRGGASTRSSRRSTWTSTSDTGHLPPRVVLQRAAIFFGWLVAFMASMATIGLIPTVPLFVIAFMRLESARAVAAGAAAGDRADDLHLHRLRLSPDHPLAADAARRLDPRAQVHPVGVRPAPDA